MKQRTKRHVAGELHKGKGKAKEAAGKVTHSRDLAAKSKVKSRAAKIQHKPRKAAEQFDGGAAPRQIRMGAADTVKPSVNMVARIARWPRDFGAWSSALLASLFRMTTSFFSYLGDAIWSISTSLLYKQRSLRAA